MCFDGETFDEPEDGDRLRAQLAKVRMIMSDGKWHTLSELREKGGYPDTSIAAISARIRDLRKKKFGGAIVERQRVRAGLWRYRMISKDEYNADG